MTIKRVALVLLCLMSGAAVAQEPKVTALMSKDLPESPGREALMITVEHAPGGSSAIHRHNAHAFVYVLEGSVMMQLKGGQQVTLTNREPLVATHLPFPSVCHVAVAGDVFRWVPAVWEY